jgi:hypothetical protein
MPTDNTKDDTLVNNDDPPLFDQNEKLEHEEYLDDEPVRKLKKGKSLRKFHHPSD